MTRVTKGNKYGFGTLGFVLEVEALEDCNSGTVKVKTVSMLEGVDENNPSFSFFSDLINELVRVGYEMETLVSNLHEL